MTFRNSSRRKSSQRRRLRPNVSTVQALEDRVLLSAVSGTGLDEFYSIDGTGNNVENPDYGSVDEQLLRLTSVEYADGVSEPAGDDRPSAREVSNAVAAQDESVVNDRYLTDWVWVWGQFIDHDIDLTENADPAEAFDIEVPEGDMYFDPDGTGTAVIGLNRSVYDPETGSSVDDPRQQINQITAFLDGSVVYGSDDVRAAELRTFEGGQLATSEGDLLPFNTAGLPNAGGPGNELFLAGDVRANENAALTAMQTLWVREHNRIAAEIAAQDFVGADLTDPDVDEQIYLRARAIVTAEIQSITYNEFLPALLGEDALLDYAGYDPTVDPGISNIFSTASYRLGHSLLSSGLLRLDADGNVIDAGNLSLQEAFFAPDELIDNGIESLLRGLAAQEAQEIDTLVVDDVRNFLFGQPGSGGFDLVSLNIQRGRDHGLPDYNQARIDLGLDPAASFADITSDPELAAKLEEVYGDVDNVDVWVGGLAEDHLPGSSVGELIQAVMVDQFERLRDGDRLWYQNVFSGDELIELENTTLADIIERNTDINGLQENVFYDESVLFYDVAFGGGPADVTIMVGPETVDIVDNRSGDVLESRPVESVTQVKAIGSRSTGDRFVVDASSGAYSPAAGVVVHGGGGHDRLIVRGTAEADSILVDDGYVTVNGAGVAYTGFEALVVRARAGDDYVEVVDGDYPPLTIKGGAGADVIYGGDGPDVIEGGRGDDIIYGFGGNDRLFGGPGDDELYGGPGHDTIIGGPGHDVEEQGDGGRRDDKHDRRRDDDRDRSRDRKDEDDDHHRMPMNDLDLAFAGLQFPL